MLANPDHKKIRALANELLQILEHTPDGKVKVCNEMLPLARFENGFVTPNNHRPNVVYVELDGELWRKMRTGKKWQRV